MRDRIGVMDLGTNTFHLLIAEATGNGFSIVHREKQPVKIGKGGINKSVILPDALERAVSCMQAFKARLDEFGVTRFQAVGTSAFRSAGNAIEVVEAIRKATGIEVEIITGDQEAAYIHRGICAAMDLGTTPVLIVDIGGGSVEFIIAKGKQLLWKTSLDIGAQRLLEQYHRHDPILAEEIELLEVHCNQMLAPLMEAAATWKPDALVGSSGTFDTLSEIHCVYGGIPYHPEDPETPLTISAFEKIHRDIICKNREQRLEIPGMIEFRVDMIVVASCLISFILKNIALKKIRVSTFSLKEGILSNLGVL